MPTSCDGHKTCTKCNELKPLSEFFARKGATDGKMSSCKVCKTAAIYAWRNENRKQLNGYQREYKKSEKQVQARKAYSARPDVRIRERVRDSIRRQDPAVKARIANYEKSAGVVAYRQEYKSQDHRKAAVREAAKRPHVRERHRARQALIRATPKGSINNRMSGGIRQAINKQRESWVSLVGYTCGELMGHLEKQFLPGMGWHNFGSWEIDHIVPQTDFEYSSPSDSEFLACWALSNLRPLWSDLNRAKSAKQHFLI